MRAVAMSEHKPIIKHKRSTYHKMRCRVNVIQLCEYDSYHKRKIFITAYHKFIMNILNIVLRKTVFEV